MVKTYPRQSKISPGPEPEDRPNIVYLSAFVKPNLNRNTGNFAIMH